MIVINRNLILMIAVNRDLFRLYLYIKYKMVLLASALRKLVKNTVKKSFYERKKN